MTNGGAVLRLASVSISVAIPRVVLIQRSSKQGAADAACNCTERSATQYVSKHSTASATGDRAHRAIPASAMTIIILATVGVAAVILVTAVVRAMMAIMMTALSKRRIRQSDNASSGKCR